MLSSISIRIKIIVSQVFLVALVSVFIYTYYPSQQKQVAINGIQSKIKSISNMFSIGVGIGMGETDLVAISEALNWANSDSSIVYISVVNSQGTEIASHDVNKLKIPKALEAIQKDSVIVGDNMLYCKNTILYQGMSFGWLIVAYSLEPMERDIAELKRTTLYFSLGLFVAGVVVAVVIGNMISGNIRHLDNAVNTISYGTESTRVKVRSKDEIGKLANAFNHMLDRLEHSRKELILYSEQLEKQNDELNQFSYVVSHDLKAPLRAIFKLSEWIEEDLGDNIPAETKMHIQTLRGRVFRLEALINGLLEYAKIGRINIASEKTDMQVLLKEVIDLLNPPPNFTITIQQGMPVFKTKKILLQQVFSNLISNAIKYNDKTEGVINIGVKETTNFYQFWVEDNGIGIDPAYHTKVFTIFQTLESRDKVEGTGVGLSIIKKAVEDVGGNIKLESSVGKGAKFIFTWPKGENATMSEIKNISVKKITA